MSGAEVEYGEVPQKLGLLFQCGEVSDLPVVALRNKQSTVHVLIFAGG